MYVKIYLILFYIWVSLPALLNNQSNFLSIGEQPMKTLLTFQSTNHIPDHLTDPSVHMVQYRKQNHDQQRSVRKFKFKIIIIATLYNYI